MKRFFGVMKDFFKSVNGFIWAFVLLFVVFFSTGLATLGTTATTGESATLAAGKAMTFNVSSSTSAKLDSIYINVGTIYVQQGQTAKVTVKYSTSASSTTSWTTVGGEQKLANVYSNAQNAVSGINYNWHCVAKGLNRSDVKRISISSDQPLDLNEIVCFDAKGEKMNITAYTTNSVYKSGEIEKAFDAQGSFSSNKSAYYNLTQDEAYFMISADNVLNGDQAPSDGYFIMDRDYNFLATAFVSASVSIFGESAFALRFPSFIATSCLLVFVYLFARALTRSEKYGFIIALFAALGGTFLSVGRMGTPVAIVASALMASLYFMYKFFSKGILSAHVIKGGLNVLFSGLFAAVALSIDATAVLPIIGILVLFGFGMRRQHLAYKVMLAKTEGMDESTVNAAGETVVVNKAANKAKADYAAKTRVCYGFVALSLVAVFVFLLLGAIVCYSAYVRSYNANGVSFLEVIVRGGVLSIRTSNMTLYTAGNVASVFAWFLPIHAATVYGGAGSGNYLAWSVLPNILLVVACFAAFVAVTVKVILDFVKKNSDKEALRLRRAYIILLGGMVAVMLAAIVRNYANVSLSMLFFVLYLCFIPLAMSAYAKGKAKLALNIVFWCVVALSAVIFLLSIPSVFGFSISSGASKMFTWMSLSGNPFFKI